MFEMRHHKAVSVGTGERSGRTLITLRTYEPPQVDALNEHRRERYRRRAVAQMRDLRSARAEAGLDPNGSEGWAKPSRRFWCGKARPFGSVGIKVRETENGPRAHFSGVQHCGSVWCCPTCAPVIRRERGEEVAEGMRRHVANGGGAVFVTYTVRHAISDSLADSKRTLLDAYSDMARSRAFRSWRDGAGMVGSIISTETTYGRHGWHFHRHVVYLLDHEVGEAEAGLMAGELFSMWEHAVDRAGGRTVSRDAFDLRPIGRGTERLAAYVSKISSGIEGLGREVALADVKSGRATGSVAPFQLLDIQTPEAERLWDEYAKAMRGVSSVRWSRGLRDRLGMGKERTDREIVEELERLGESRAMVSPSLFNRRVARRHEVACRLLEAVERGDAAEAERIIGGRAYVVNLQTGPVLMFEETPPDIRKAC